MFCVLIMVGVVAGEVTFVKSHSTVHLILVHFTVHKLHVNKINFIKKHFCSPNAFTKE